MKTKTVHFANNQEKAEFMHAGAVHDSKRPQIKRLSQRFRTNNDREQAQNILDFVQKAITYRRDPAGEVLEDSEATIERGFGDCDAKTRVFVAMCLASGLRARTKPVFRGKRFPHVLAEVFLDGSWIEADPSYYDAPLGSKGHGTNND